ncbi:MAG: TonB-dependent receptor [Sphingomonas sanxanigenens]|uniref:TonB-dependent receptor n=1 Tax=Sphingomonas sanxanigenens TaxID=397260 RepID=A0A2W5CAR6_9SPHN|nr:MAG: TonB-dependent receptor [Sphingomonas sanxanigenens]
MKNIKLARAFWLASAGILSGALCAGNAYAADDAAPAAATAPVADAGGEGLGDIVVTATKRETNLQKTPIAISVVSEKTLVDRHVQSLIDLADGGIPSLRIATFEARQSALTVGIRGIVPFDANQTARDQGVGVYVDGVYLGRQQGLNAALFDVQRIEVLRGPQGTLFGRNTEGGAVSIVTKDPTGEFGGRLTGGFGNYGSYTTEAHVDLPAFGNLAVKVDGLIQHQDPTVKNPLAGQAGWNQYNRVGGRISAKWTPTDNLTMLLSYDKAKDENTPFYSQLVNYNPNNYPVATLAQINANGGKLPAGFIAPLSPLVTVSGDHRMKVADIGVPQQPSVDRTEGVAFTIKYKISPNIELRSITGARNVTTDQWDNSGGAHRTVFLPNSNFSRYSLSYLHQNQVSQEFQLVGSLPQIDYVAGLYYFSENAREEAATPSSNKWNADGTGYTINSESVPGAITSGNQGWDRASWFRQRGSEASAHSYAAFGQFTFTPDALGDIVHLTAGGRYTRDKRNGTLYLVQGKATNFTFNYSKGRFDPMVTLAVDAAPGVNLYAKYSTGYRAGGANDRSQTFQAFGPEVVKSYEIGAKTDFFDHRVRLNVAGYLMDRTGTQTDFDNVDTNPASPTYNLHTEETRNAPGKSKIRGVEADLTVNPVEGLTLGASYAYTHTKVPPTPNPFLNNRPFQVYVVYTPKNAASGFIDYSLPVSGNGMGLRLHLDANYASPQRSFQAESVQSDSSFIVNGRLALADIPMTGEKTKLTVAVWTRNLFNETHIYRRSAANSSPTANYSNGVLTGYSYGGVLGDYANFNPPRTFGVEATLNF